MTMVTERLGLTLLNFVWQGAGLAVVLSVVLVMLRRARPQARYLAACITLAVMAIAPLFTFMRLNAGAYGRASGGVAVLAAGAAYRALTPVTGGYSAVFERALFWLVALWMAGVVLLAFRWMAAWIALERRMERAGRTAPLPGVIKAFERVAQSMRVARRIPILMVDWLESPAVTGVMRPVLLVPASAVLGLSAAQLEAVLAHELAHIRRWDTLVSLLQTAVETLYYFHPAVWWVSRRIRIEREHCCDDAAVAACGNRRTYASALAELELSRHAGAPMAAAPALAATSGGHLKSRIRRVLYPTDATVGASPAAGLIVLAGMLLAIWGGTSMVAAPVAADSPYEKWLNEDVVYIIQPTERKAFQELKSNTEREKFIEQFWERRNPAPGSPDNKFKKEHYRRIGYADERFGETDLAGWHTDRGRIYIVYGPPDEIESHPSAEREVWLYHELPGIGTNVLVEFVKGRQTSDPNTGK